MDDLAVQRHGDQLFAVSHVVMVPFPFLLPRTGMEQSKEQSEQQRGHFPTPTSEGERNSPPRGPGARPDCSFFSAQPPSGAGPDLPRGFVLH